MRKPNIILIVLDTLREDYAQGLDRLLDYGFVKYQNAIAPAPWTLPSHVSMFTGLYPSEHGIHETKELRGYELIKYSQFRMKALADYNIMTKLRDEGYTTYLISANSAFVNPIAGFEADVNIVIDPITNLVVTKDIMTIATIEAELEKLGGKLNFLIHNLKEMNITKLAIGAKLFLLGRLKTFPKHISERFIREKGGRLVLSFVKKLQFKEPFFLFVNLMESHNPYTVLREDRNIVCSALRWVLTGRLQPEDKRFWRTYPMHAERAIKRAIELISIIGGKYDLGNTLIIITSDHGELLGNDGAYHIYSLRDGNIRVPLYVKYPESWKKKKQKTYISLTELSKILNPQIDTIGSEFVIAETFGPHYADSSFEKCGFEKPSINIFHHKIRILGKKTDILFDKTLGEVEYAKGEGAGQILAELFRQEV